MSTTKQLLQQQHVGIVKWFLVCGSTACPLRSEKGEILHRARRAPSNPRAAIPCHPLALGTPFLQQRAAGLGAKSLCGVIAPCSPLLLAGRDGGCAGGWTRMGSAILGSWRAPKAGGRS